MTSKPFFILFRLQSPTPCPDLCLLHTTQVSTPRSKPPTSLRSPRMSVSAYPIFILLANAEASCSPLGHSCSLRQGHPKVKRLPPFSYLSLSLVLFILLLEDEHRSTSAISTEWAVSSVSLAILAEIHLIDLGVHGMKVMFVSTDTNHQSGNVQISRLTDI